MISNKCQYALRAMLELAKHQDGSPVSIHIIAEKQQIPARFLEAILRQLKQTGLARSVRGKDGGYILTKKPEDISMGEIIHIFEGELLSSSAANFKQGEHCVFQSVFTEASECLSTIFENKSLKDLIKEDEKLNPPDIMNYAI